MTREEAVALAIKSKEQWGGGSSESWLVNALSALGMLTLDEPKSAWDRFKETFVREYDYVDDDSMPCTTLSDIKLSLEKAGLRIVEK